VGSDWSEAQLSAVQQLIQELIEQDDIFVGMGFVGAPGIIEHQDRYMMWLQRSGGRTARLRLNFDASSIDVYDYLEMDWFQLPAAGRERVAVGPYVDYAGSELYIVTASIPILTDDEFVGIAGADLLFAELERRFVKVLRTARSEAVLVNSERRVVAANSPDWVLGSRLRALPKVGRAVGDTTYAAVAELPSGTGWRLALTESN
jgi:hypothetical protein